MYFVILSIEKRYDFVYDFSMLSIDLHPSSLSKQKTNLYFKEVQKPIRGILFSDKYGLRFQDRSFDVESLF